MNALTILNQPIYFIPASINRSPGLKQPCTGKTETLKHHQQKPMVEQAPKMQLLRLVDAPAKPPFLSEIFNLLSSHGFDEKSIKIGFTGFGEIKTHLAEIGLVSTTPGFYNLHLGGNKAGNQLNKVYQINAPEEAILNELNGLLAAYKITCKPNETFGEFTLRKKLI